MSFVGEVSSLDGLGARGGPPKVTYEVRSGWGYRWGGPAPMYVQNGGIGRGAGGRSMSKMGVQISP